MIIKAILILLITILLVKVIYDGLNLFESVDAEYEEIDGTDDEYEDYE